MLTVSKNYRCKVGGRLDVTFADEICEVAETKTTYITDELNWSPKKSKVLFKKSKEDGWWTVKDYRYYARLGKFANNSVGVDSLESCSASVFSESRPCKMLELV